MFQKHEIEKSLTKYVDGVHVPAEVDRRVRQSFEQFHHQKERRQPMKKRIAVLSIAAAILVPTGVFASTGGASYFFNGSANINGLVDDSMKQALSEGKSVPMDEKISDQGITVHLKEMYADGQKIFVHYSLEQSDGTLVPYEFDTKGLDVLSDGKKDGKQVENPTYQESGVDGFSVLNFIGTGQEDRLPFYLTDAKGDRIDSGVAEKDLPEGVFAFVTDGTKLPTSVTLHVDINRIGKTKGNWKGEFSVGQSQVKQETEADRNK
ncbi:DUF4179 domain-containing protein [Paenibacillus sp. HJL G12]|uniref:DUF4179 domain-containing protein n=1 Tax=Paenibacillus dendrobii TaxID=2691084 RepID=A0A7X3IP79_9BACL|nr:DUF4179 domain-containing protein [Paenibacillus dendrobii]MWV46335.1 DUF4179 domain-containing protein [Paenibacillus dendrobii]